MNHIKFAQPYFLRETMTTGMLGSKEDEEARGAASSFFQQNIHGGQGQQSQQGEFGQGDYDPVTDDPTTLQDLEDFVDFWVRMMATGGAANQISGLMGYRGMTRQMWYDFFYNMFFGGHVGDPGGGIDGGGAGGDAGGFGQHG